jgi:hypothetical protein
MFGPVLLRCKAYFHQFSAALFLKSLPGLPAFGLPEIHVSVNKSHKKGVYFTDMLAFYRHNVSELNKTQEEIS